MKPPRITVAACSLCFLSTALTPSAMADPEDQKWGAESKGSTVDVTKSRSVEVPQGSGAGTGGGGEAAQGPVGGSEGAVAERRPLACLAQGDCGAVLGAAVGAARSRSPQQPAGGGGVVVVTAAEAQRIVAAGSGLVRQPPGPEALVSKVVIVYTSPSRQVIDTQVGGSPVRVVATPISYTWDWGDGTTTTTTDPGAPYPDHTVSHKYTSTATGVVITLTTTWQATYAVDGGPPRAVNGTLTTTNTSTPFDLVRLVTYLTDQGEEAQGH